MRFRFCVVLRWLSLHTIQLSRLSTRVTQCELRARRGGLSLRHLWPATRLVEVLQPEIGISLLSQPGASHLPSVPLADLCRRRSHSLTQSACTSISTWLTPTADQTESGRASRSIQATAAAAAAAAAVERRTDGRAGGRREAVAKATCP